MAKGKAWVISRFYLFCFVGAAIGPLILVTQFSEASVHLVFGAWLDCPFCGIDC